MADFTGLIATIKKAAVDAVNASGPMKVEFGHVIGTAPLSIAVEQKMTLEAGQLVVPKTLTNYEALIGTQTVTIYNALRMGDEVILLQMQGGQRYIVLDRLG